jgi:hypothetical protein
MFLTSPEKGAQNTSTPNAIALALDRDRDRKTAKADQ